MSAPPLDRTRIEDEVNRQADGFFVGAVRGDFHESVVIRGELDIATVPRLRDVLDTVLARQPWRLEIDLSGVTFLSVYAVSQLLATRRRLAARGGTLVLRDPTPIARRVLTLTGIDYLIGTFPAPHRTAARADLWTSVVIGGTPVSRSTRPCRTTPA